MQVLFCKIATIITIGIHNSYLVASIISIKEAPLEGYLNVK
jgi:hypothetical protein